MRKLTLVMAALCFALVLSPSIGMAAVLHTQSVVEFDWTSFNVATDAGMTLTWTSQGSSVSAMGGSITESVPDWTSALPVVDIPYGAGGKAIVNAQQLYAESGANMGAPPDTGYVLADLIANRFGNFSVSGSGNVTFTVDVMISQFMNLVGGDVVNWGDTFGMASMNVTGGTGLGSDELWNEIFSNTSANEVFNGAKTLTVSLWFDNGQSGSFMAEAYSATRAAVPEPSTMLLLGFGLAGILGFGRKKSTIEA